MTNLQHQSLQRSEWLVPLPTITYPSASRIYQTNVRSNSIRPINDNSCSTNHNLEKTSNKKSILSPFVVGLLAGTLTSCLILAVILSLWLTSESSSSSQTSATTRNPTPTLRWNTTGITVCGTTGRPGSASNQLNGPLDLFLDYNNSIYIPDQKNHRVQKFLPGNVFGQTIAGNGTAGATQYQLDSPSRLIVDSDGNLYISDVYNNRVQFWRIGDTFGTTIAGVTGSSGSGLNTLSAPYGLSLNPVSGTLYVVDRSNQRIMSYAKGTSSGSLVFGQSGTGIANTQLYNPTGLLFDPSSNSLIIGNTGANNIVRYTLGASAWTLIAGSINGTLGATSTLLSYTVDMTIDPMGNLYVVDRDNHRIQFFLNGQLSGTTIAGVTAISGNSTTTLYQPRSVKLDSQLNLYVADAANHRIQKFLRY